MEDEAVTKGVTSTVPGVTLEQQPGGFQKATEVGASDTNLPRGIKTGLMIKKPAVELKGVRDD